MKKRNIGFWIVFALLLIAMLTVLELSKNTIPGWIACLAAAALGVGPGDLLNDLETCGSFFETLCIRDLRVYTEALDGSVYHFRTKEGLERDAVIHLRNGSYGLVEVKLGGDKLIEEGAHTLKTVAGKIDTTKMKEPSFLMVLTGTSPYAYRREDGVYVVPITALKN